jgi:hypothetical protein
MAGRERGGGRRHRQRLHLVVRLERAMGAPHSGQRQWSGHRGVHRGTVDVTPSSVGRSATLTIAGQTFTVNQDGAPCTYVVSPAAVDASAGGAAGVFEVNTAEGCGWTAVSNDPWLRVTFGAGGSGDGTVGYSVDPNPGGARVGSISAGGRTFLVTQAGTSQ